MNDFFIQLIIYWMWLKINIICNMEKIGVEIQFVFVYSNGSFVVLFVKVKIK